MNQRARGEGGGGGTKPARCLSSSSYSLPPAVSARLKVRNEINVCLKVDHPNIAR